MLRISSPLTQTEETVVTQAMDCAFAVHRELGPGFRERIYQRAYCLELELRNLRFEREKTVDVRYKKWLIPGQRVDLLVEGVVLVEIKAIPRLVQLHDRQVRSYLKTLNLRVALLINFNTMLLKQGLRRLIRT